MNNGISEDIIGLVAHALRGEVSAVRYRATLLAEELEASGNESNVATARRLRKLLDGRDRRIVSA